MGRQCFKQTNNEATVVLLVGGDNRISRARNGDLTLVANDLAAAHAQFP